MIEFAMSSKEPRLEITFKIRDMGNKVDRVPIMDLAFDQKNAHQIWLWCKMNYMNYGINHSDLLYVNTQWRSLIDGERVGGWTLCRTDTLLSWSHVWHDVSDTRFWHDVSCVFLRIVCIFKNLPCVVSISTLWCPCNIRRTREIETEKKIGQTWHHTTGCLTPWFKWPYTTIKI